MTEQRALPLEQYHRAGREITNGNREVYKRLYSRNKTASLPSGAASGSCTGTEAAALSATGRSCS